MPRLQGDKDVASCHPVQREVPWRAEVPLLASLLVLPLLQLVMRPLLSRRASVAMAAGSVQAAPDKPIGWSSLNGAAFHLAKPTWQFISGAKKNSTLMNSNTIRETVLKILGSLCFCVESDAYSIILF